MTTINRREFVKVTGVSAISMTLGSVAQAATSTNKNSRPNIIFIFTDQQSATMMSCTGNRWLKTPAMDYIAENGIRFERAYTTNPVCVPARIGMMTGRFPGDFSHAKGPVRTNRGGLSVTSVSEEVKQTTIAAFLKKAGYELAYGGKTHLPKALHPKTLGFNFLTRNERDELADSCARYIKQKHDKPYYLVASFINPHDICYMALRERFDFNNCGAKPGVRYQLEERRLIEAMKLPDGVGEKEFLNKHCPPLPRNFEPQTDEPEAVKALLSKECNGVFRKYAREKYRDNDWRLHRWAYCQLTEMVDRQIQVILDALKESGQEENTIVIFSSDHGDMDSSHRLEHKTALYEESANVPFTAMWKGHISAGRVDDTHLVSTGLDLLPTVCDFAGIKGVADPRGRSLRPLMEGKRVDWRKTLGVESQIGRMVVSEDKFKYIKYDIAGIEEQLLNLNDTPLEAAHVTSDPQYTDKLKQLKTAYQTEWFPGL